MNNIKRNLVILCAIVITLAACQETKPDNKTTETYKGLNLEYMDTTVNPGDDFYQFVNGTWLKEVEIPADRGRWGSFNILRKTTMKNTLKVLKSAAENENLDPESAQAKAARFFRLAMDTSYLDSLGLKPVMGLINEIDAIEEKAGIFQYITEKMAVAGGPFFGLGVSASFENSSMNALYLSPSGIGMPERNYYLKDDKESQETQMKYKQMLTDVFQLLYKDSDNSQIAENIYQLEKSLAKNMMSKEMRRNANNLNNPMSVQQIDEIMTVADFSQLLKTQGITDVDTLIVTQPDYFEAMGGIIQGTDLTTLKNYMKWMVLNSYKSYLNSELKDITFEFYGKELSGVDQMKPRWERVLGTANRALDQAIGKLYVEEYFPPEAKEVAKELVNNILDVFGERIKALEWMTDSTKVRALEKLSTFTIKIGYPDKWKDYSKLTIKGEEQDGSYAGNMMAISQWEWEKDKKDINQPVDKSEWFMGPQIVNAYYNPPFNEIVFPAAILQPPFFSFKADPALNYGGIGAVIGHEISHGFDDSGSRFDAQGNLNNWWTDQDREAFKKRTQELVDQFNGYKPFEDLAVNGEYTLGENIGDLGGVNVAYQALQKHLEKHGNPGKIDGFTQNQRFFISWATIWRTKYKDEALRTQIMTDPHAPGNYRAIGPISNMAAFYKAFDIGKDAKMFIPKDERVKIW